MLRLCTPESTLPDPFASSDVAVEIAGRYRDVWRWAFDGYRRRYSSCLFPVSGVVTRMEPTYWSLTSKLCFILGASLQNLNESRWLGVTVVLRIFSFAASPGAPLQDNTLCRWGTGYFREWQYHLYKHASSLSFCQFGP